MCRTGSCSTAALRPLTRCSECHVFSGKLLFLLVHVCLTPALLIRQTSRYRKLKAPTSNPHSFLQVRFNSQSYSFLQPFYFYFSPAAFSALLSNSKKKQIFHSSSFTPPDFISSQPLGHTNHSTSIYITIVRNSGTSNTLVFSSH